MEHTILALWVSAWMTDLFADIGWLEFQSKYLKVWDFLYTVVCIVLFEIGVHLVSKKRMFTSLSGCSIVSFIWSSILFVWLERMSTWSFYLCRLHYPHISSTMVWGRGIVVPVPVLQNIPCTYLLWQVRVGDPLLLLEVASKTCVGSKNTQLFKTSSRKEIILSLGMFQEGL